MKKKRKTEALTLTGRRWSRPPMQNVTPPKGTFARVVVDEMKRRGLW